jgi:hypothetical protein
VFWTWYLGSDPYGLPGSVQPVAPSCADGFDPYNPGGVPAHHIAAGILGILAGLSTFVFVHLFVYTSVYQW